MEEEIDLRPYIEAVIKHWYWIVGAAILAGIAAFIISSFIPPTYEAIALVAVIPSTDVVQFDERFREGADSQPLRAFPQLALSDQVLQTLLLKAENGQSVEDVRQQLDAEVGDDATILQLTAVSENPAEAADLVNSWAAVFVNWANNVYGEQGGDQARFFEERLVVANVELAAAEDALTEFQAINRTSVISNTLASSNEQQAQLLASQIRANTLLEDAQFLRDQLAQQPNGEPVTFADQLTALSLQLQTFNVDTAVPLQLQVETTSSLTSDSRTEQLAMLDNLLATLALQVAQTENKLTELEPQILNLQQQLEESQTVYGRLFRDKVVAEETYNALARKVEEERITSADTVSGVRLASEAVVPQNPVGTRKLIIVVLASFMAATVVVFAIILIVWWRGVSE